MVQAWQMAFRAPAMGVLSPRPGTQANQAYFAAPPPGQPFGAASSSTPLDVWNN